MVFYVYDLIFYKSLVVISLKISLLFYTVRHLDPEMYNSHLYTK